MQLLGWVLPSEAAVLVLVAIGFAVMVGLKGAARSLLGLLAVLVLSPLLMPFLGQVLDALPLWLLLILAVWLCMSFLRTVLSAVIGREAANTAVGHLASEGILGALKVMFLPIRWLFRRL